MTDDVKALIEEARAYADAKDAGRGHDGEGTRLLRALASRLEALEAAQQWRMLAHTDEEHAMLFGLGSFLGAIEYRHVRTGSHWQIDTLSIDDETGDLQQDTGWGLNDYTHWRPLPLPPQMETRSNDE